MLAASIYAQRYGLREICRVIIELDCERNTAHDMRKTVFQYPSHFTKSFSRHKRRSLFANNVNHSCCLKITVSRISPLNAHRQSYGKVLYDSDTVPTSQNCLITVRRARNLNKHSLVPMYSPLT